jgi:hypothetical protein
MLQETGQGVSLDVLHDDEMVTRTRADLQDGHDVRVTYRCCETRLVEKHVDEVVLRRQVRQKTLDGAEALESAQALEPRKIHRRHAARRDFAEEFVPIEAFDSMDRGK